MNTNLKELQSFSLETAFKAGEEWTSTETDVLAKARAEGLNYFAIAKMLNRTVYSVTTQARVVGIAKPHRNVRKSKKVPVPACVNCNLVHSYKECD